MVPEPRLALSADERLALYLAPLAAHARQRFPTTADAALLVNPRKSFAFSLERSRDYLADKSFRDDPVVLARLQELYVDPVVAAYRRLGLDRRFQLVIGDDLTANTTPTYHKARRIEDGGASVLLPLNERRHFEPIHTVEASDVPFDEKQGRVVWRGATTGYFRARPHGSRYHLYRHWDRFEANAGLDLGFSPIVQLSKGFAAAHGDIERCARPRLTLAQQLQAKYLLALEGNDVASGLKWMLASNSLVIMPRPTNESWACESRLVPGVHYVEIRHDLADLEEAYAWCEANPRACREMAENGKRFMRGFRDKAQEATLFDEVVREYHRRVRLVDPHNLVTGEVAR
ncbi:glycosyl transferase family 90 [Acuticoccus sp. I52.16.1]|uniref:glycosyl transferase family 90 n=1 Tax=Acuticoccus sp. I52.16.1 TaxID=2928472 RepID=UPI001FD3B5E6|nr:glycosyl transferase family 90 [Acuticoccus sp. I52.16.1]UOM33399.1 hypothetical protein MRB58_16265 [Acuticoccus sp. I52.16.1]